MQKRYASTLGLGLAMALTGACTGKIGVGTHAGDDPGGPASGSGAQGEGPAPGSDAPGDEAPGTADDPQAPGASPDGFEPAPAALRRLTATQYENSVRALLGSGVSLTVVLEPDTVLNGFVEIAAARATISPSAMEKYEAAAFELAGQALAPGARDALVPCEPAAVTDSACTRSFLQSFGRRAFRRPLDDEELGRYLELSENAATMLGDFHAGLEFAVAAMLQSPNFLFRVEVGEPDPANPERLRYTGYEMASRLSFLFWNTTPDDALLDAAEAGELVTSAGLATQVARLLEDPRTREAMNNFHAERLGIEGLEMITKDADLFPSMSPALAGSMREDILRTLDYLAFEAQADFREVFDTRVAFVDGSLAELYGLPAPASGFERVELPAEELRLGLLGKAGLLAQNAHVTQTSPTLRGKFVRERVLCQSIPAPPNNVVTIIPEPNPDAPTMRERLASHREVASCAACHSLMDPIGLAFENFDAVGAYRETDNGHELDTSGDLDGATFADPKELATLLRGLPDASECLVRQLYRYAVAHVETSGEIPVIEALSQELKRSGHGFPALLGAVVQSDGFRYAATEVTP